MTADLSSIKPGVVGTAILETGPAHAASAVGSGALDVLASPVMIALMEAAAVNCLEGLLPAGCTSLGTKLDVTHEAPTAIGARIAARAEITSVEARRIVFKVQAHDPTGLIGHGEHHRAIVDIGRFLAKLRQRSESSQD